MITQLSQNFTIAEFEKSDTAEEYGIDNTMPPDALYSAVVLATRVLQPIRNHFGRVKLNSAYRCPPLNHRVGGDPNSQHVDGKAADIECASDVDNLELAEWIRDNLDFDQCILEKWLPDVKGSGWVHVSYNEEGDNRNEVLTYSDGVYTAGLPGR